MTLELTGVEHPDTGNVVRAGPLTDELMGLLRRHPDLVNLMTELARDPTSPDLIGVFCDWLEDHFKTDHSDQIQKLRIQEGDLLVVQTYVPSAANTCLQQMKERYEKIHKINFAVLIMPKDDVLRHADEKEKEIHRLKIEVERIKSLYDRLSNDNRGLRERIVDLEQKLEFQWRDFKND